jgi:hypothetical protein
MLMIDDRVVGGRPSRPVQQPRLGSFAQRLTSLLFRLAA